MMMSLNKTVEYGRFRADSELNDWEAGKGGPGDPTQRKGMREVGWINHSGPEDSEAPVP